MDYKCTDNVLEILDVATYIAKGKGKEFVGTEHVLHAILLNENGIAYKILRDFHVEPSRVYNMLERGYCSKRILHKFSPKLNDALDDAEELRKNMNAEVFGSEILFFAILKQKDNNCISILKEIVPDFQELFDAVFKYINEMYAQSHDDIYDDKSALETYGKNLNELAKNGKIDEVYGRQEEIKQILKTLSRKTKNNPCLVGEAGVGKTAIIYGLANEIVKGQVPEQFKDTTIYLVDILSMIAGSKYRGEFEERLKKLLDEATKTQNIILFLDEIHTIIGTGSSEGSLDTANILKPYLTSGDLKIIGATTTDEYRKHIEKDSALERRFQKIVVEEPSKEETIDILKNIKSSYEAFHNVLISDEVILEIVNLSERFISDRHFPDKAIDVLDEVCSTVNNSRKTKKSSEIDDEIKDAINHDDIVSAINLSSKQKEGAKSSNAKKPKTVEIQDVRKVISNWSKVPIEGLTKNEFEVLGELESNMKKQIIGQDKAIELITKAIKRSKTGIKDPKKPIGTFLFLGPTGCGKTETCKALARELFKREDSIIRFDMSEYMEKHEASKLIGAPPGYVGFEEGGSLTNKVREKPYSIILFDEIEKAHPDIFNVLLQVLDEGALTDSNGRKVDFKNTIIIMTSNIGAKEFAKEKKMGFSMTSNEGVDKEVETNVMSELKKSFNPEFLNRLDEIIVFNRLSKEDITKIANNIIADTLKRISNYKVTIDDSLKEEIVKQGYSTEYGARPIKRAVQKLVENPIADFIIEKKGDIREIKLSYDGTRTVIK